MLEPASSATWAGVARRIHAMLDRPLRRRLEGVVVLFVLVALFEILAVGGIAAFVTSIGSPSLLVAAASRKLGLLGARLEGMEDREVILLLGAGMVVLMVAKNALRAWADRQAAVFSCDLDAWFGGLALERILTMPYVETQAYKQADLFRYVDWRTYVGSDFARSFLIMAQNASIMALVLAALLVSYPALSLVLLALLGGGALGIYRLLRPRIDRTTHAYIESVMISGRQVMHCLQGIREIKLFGIESRSLVDVRAVLSAVAHARSRGMMAVRVPSYLLEAGAITGLVTATTALTWLGSSSSSVTTAAAVLAVVAMRMITSMNSALAELTGIRGAVPFAQRLLDFLGQPEPLAPPKEQGEPLGLSRSLELRGVSFSYRDSARAAVQDVSLEVRKGELVGVVGLSGAGKSTLLDLVSGILRPTRGEVLVDSRPLDDDTYGRWMRGIGYVGQSPFFFDGTVAQNISFETRTATYDRERVEACCRMACVDFLEPELGIETRLIDGGANLSVGQRQRIAIARALYRDAALLILDEPTSALDPCSEQRIQALLADMRGTRTVLIIAHRLTSVEACERILWIRDGQVGMDGPARQVLEAYATYVRERVHEDGRPSAPAEAPGPS